MKMNLLIVNDEILTTKILKEDINWKLYGIDQVYTAYNAESGKKSIQELEIDILLCDIEMPGENGISLLRWAREQKFELECIFLTCHASFEYAKEAIMLECQNYILTPARNEEIGAAVRKVVNKIQDKRNAEIFQIYGEQVLKAKIDKETEHLQAKKSSKEIVKEVILYILNNLGNESLTVNEIADNFYMHPVYLNRIFKKEKKISIGKFIIGERMKYAAELLKSKKLSAVVVAEKVGYVSYTNFNAMFKKYYGSTPTQYQEENEQTYSPLEKGGV